MARKRTPTLTEAELRLMNIIWERGEATVNEVVEALPNGLDLAYNTVLTTMRILEHKEYLERSKVGRSHTYRPLVNKNQAQRSAMKHIVKSFFDDSPRQLLLSMLQDKELTANEINQLKDMIDAAGENK